jgi:hypothetical protein
MTRYLFLDTMVFLHFRPLDELNLSSIAGGDFVVVIPRITLKELDAHKSTHKSTRIQDRARRALSEIEAALSKGTPLKGGIAIEQFPVHPKEQLERLHLNAGWGDDLLIASIVAHREATGLSTQLLISQDTGPRLTARANGIEAVELSEDLMLPPEPDPVEKENRELRQQIQALQNAMPKLSIVFADSTDTTNVRRLSLVSPRNLAANVVQELVQQVRYKFPHMAEIPAVPKTVAEEVAAASFNRIAPLAVVDYNKELDIYYRSCEQYIHQLHEFQETQRLRFSLTLAVQNNGTAPADDVDITIHFPDGFLLLSADQLPVGPKAPKPPEKPLGKFDQIRRAQNWFADVIPNFPTPSFEMPSSFSIKKSHSYDVSDHFERVKQGTSERLPTFHLEFPSFDQAKSFRCDYQIISATLPKPVTGELHVVVERQEGHPPSQDDA